VAEPAGAALVAVAGALSNCAPHLDRIVMAAAYRVGVAGFDRDAAQRRPFPALDPEPPPRPWWWRLVLPAVTLALVGVVVATVQLQPFSSGPPRPAAAGQPAASVAPGGGRIVALTPAGQLALSDPDGRHEIRTSGLENVGGMAAVSPDNRYLSVGSGQVIVIRHGHVLTPYPAAVPLSSATTAAWPDPFADHERSLVMLLDYGSPAQSSSNPISVVSLTAGRSVALGVGDQVAGDPQAAGIFVSVAAPASPSATPLQANPDSGILLRDAGRAPVVLATAGALNRDLGQAPGLPVSLAPYPSPSGAEVAVTIRPAAGGTAGVVVLSRAGRLLGRVIAPLTGQSVPTWSPSGRSLAFPTSGGAGPQLRIWMIGRPAAASELPASGGSYGWCVWSPDGMSILCVAADGRGWAIASAAGGRVVAVRGPGFPLAWLP
jgi:hypothetical protein